MSFISGMELSERFFKEEVYKILKTNHKKIKYSAGLIGRGSEVLGFDTKRSQDHDWGPRVIIFLEEEDYQKKDKIQKSLVENLPKTFLGYSTHFKEVDENGVRVMSKLKKGDQINHGVSIYTTKKFFNDYLGINPYEELTALDWLILSEQKLRTIKSGKIFYDKLGLEKIQKKLTYYPKDVWLYLLMSEWTKIGQEESFMGRCGEVKDELGSRIIATRLVQSIMNLMFMMEKEYIPYSKWYGKAFSRLTNTKKISKLLQKILTADKWKTREKVLSKAYKIIGDEHNKLKITKKLSTRVKEFHDRPYLVIDGERFAEEIRKQMEDESLLKIKTAIGSVNQITKTVDILESNELLKQMGNLYK